MNEIKICRSLAYSHYVYPVQLPIDILQCCLGACIIGNLDRYHTTVKKKVYSQVKG